MRIYTDKEFAGIWDLVKVRSTTLKDAWDLMRPLFIDPSTGEVIAVYGKDNRIKVWVLPYKAERLYAGS